MKTKISIDKIYEPSKDVVCREVQGEFILVPLVAGMDKNNEAIFTLNETGRLIWGKLDKKKSVRKILSELSLEFDSPDKEIQDDVLGLLKELLDRKMIVKS